MFSSLRHALLVFYPPRECARNKIELELQPYEKPDHSKSGLAHRPGLPRRRSFSAGALRLPFAAALVYLSAPPRLCSSLPSAPTLYQHLSQPHLKQRLFSLPTCDTCDTHHIHSLTSLKTHTTSPYPKTTLRDTSCLTAADTAVVEEATAAVAVVAAGEEATAAGMTTLEIAVSARRTTIPTGMPQGLCAFDASVFIHNSSHFHMY